jgi:hypothetical protein
MPECNDEIHILDLHALAGQKCVRHHTGIPAEEVDELDVVMAAGTGFESNPRLFVTSKNAKELGVTSAGAVNAGDFIMVDGFILEVEIEDVFRNSLWMTTPIPEAVRIGVEIHPIVTNRWNPPVEVDPDRAAREDEKRKKFMIEGMKG